MISFIGSTRIHSPQFTVCEGGMKPVERQVALSACLPFRSTAHRALQLRSESCLTARSYPGSALELSNA